MKGPSERLKYDMRRIWECPICRHREGTGGNVTSRMCSCQEQVSATSRQYMRMVQDGARRLIAAKVAPMGNGDGTDRTDGTDKTDLSNPSNSNPTDLSNPSDLSNPNPSHPSEIPP